MMTIHGGCLDDQCVEHVNGKNCKCVYPYPPDTGWRDMGVSCQQSALAWATAMLCTPEMSHTGCLSCSCSTNQCCDYSRKSCWSYVLAVLEIKGTMPTLGWHKKKLKIFQSHNLETYRLLTSITDKWNKTSGPFHTCTCTETLKKGFLTSFLIIWASALQA